MSLIGNFLWSATQKIVPSNDLKLIQRRPARIIFVHNGVLFTLNEDLSVYVKKSKKTQLHKRAQEEIAKDLQWSISRELKSIDYFFQDKSHKISSLEVFLLLLQELELRFPKVECKFDFDNDYNLTLTLTKTVDKIDKLITDCEKSYNIQKSLGYPDREYF